MRRTPLLVVADPEVISSGLVPDRHAILTPLWETAQNVRFYQGKVRRLLPASALFNPVSVDALNGMRGIHQQQNSDGIRWVMFAYGWSSAGVDNIWVYKWYGAGAPAQILGQANTSLNDTGLVQTTQVDFQAWGDWTLINTSKGAIYRHIPAGGSGNLPNAPVDVVAIMKKQNQLLAIGHGIGKRQVSWSDADDITDWTATAENLAGSLTIEELQQPIRAAARLGTQIACYTEDQMALVYWIGAPFYFGQRVALDGIGAVGKMAVCADGRLNYGVSRNGIWQTDGNDYRYIDHGMLSDYLQRTVNWAQGGKVVAFRNDVTRCIEFHFPMLGSGSLENTEAWSYDPSTGGWAPVPAYQALTERSILNKPLAGKNAQVFLLDDNAAAAGALSLATRPLLIDQENIIGLHIDAKIDEVEIAALRASNVQFKIMNATDIDGPWESSAWQTLNPDMRTYRMESMPTGTFHKLVFQSTADNWDLDLQGFAFFGNIEGVKRDNI